MLFYANTAPIQVNIEVRLAKCATGSTRAECPEAKARVTCEKHGPVIPMFFGFTKWVSLGSHRIIVELEVLVGTARRSRRQRQQRRRRRRTRPPAPSHRSAFGSGPRAPGTARRTLPPRRARRPHQPPAGPLDLYDLPIQTLPLGGCSHKTFNL